MKAPNLYQTWDEVNACDHVVTIKWGRDGEQENTYGFNTYIEKEAFLMGVEQSNGWLEYEMADISPWGD